MNKKYFGLLLLPAIMLCTGCALKAPPYNPAMNNVQKLAAIETPINVKQVKLAKPELNVISLRGSSMEYTPKTYADYLQDALNAELAMANKMGAIGGAQLSATITENDIDVSGFSTGSGKIAARFILVRNQTEVYNKLVHGSVSFPSSFMGSIAIPNAMNAYPDLVADLLKSLYSDDAFINATKK